MEKTDTQTEQGQGLLRAFFSRGDFVFATAAIAMLCGFLLPIPAKALDILWVFNICLAMMVVFIAFSAKNSSEISSFPLLLVSTIVLRIVSGVASVRMILLDGQAGTVIAVIGKGVYAGSYVWMLMILSISAVIVWVIMFTAVRRIVKAAAKFLVEIMPIKLVGVGSDLSAGAITKTEAANLREKIAKEKQFYLNMTGAAKLLYCDGALAGLIVMAFVVGQSVVSFLNRSSETVAADTYTLLGAGASVLVLVTAITVALTTAHLLGKSTLSISTAQEQSEKRASKKVQIVSEQTGDEETVELLNPDFAEVSADTIKAAVKPEPKPEKESIVSFEPVVEPVVETVATPKSVQVGVIDKFDDIDDYYDKIAGRVCKLKKDQMPVLFAADGIDDLPVTVAVNVGIRLAQEGLRTLLIDADGERNAIARVFDVEPGASEKDSVETCIEDLFVWTIDKGCKGSLFKEMIQSCDRVVIYAPNLGSSSIGKAIAGLSKNAIVFSKKTECDDKLSALLKTGQCQLLAVAVTTQNNV
ncbi:MAG TPA: hypothetical protein ENH94_03930 [Phycisphaerales bacterium]|nr:hypothetical protein [Phycisphaerales bacterium]